MMERMSGRRRRAALVLLVLLAAALPARVHGEANATNATDASTAAETTAPFHVTTTPAPTTPAPSTVQIQATPCWASALMELNVTDVTNASSAANSSARFVYVETTAPFHVTSTAASTVTVTVLRICTHLKDTTQSIQHKVDSHLHAHFFLFRRRRQRPASLSWWCLPPRAVTACGPARRTATTQMCTATMAARAYALPRLALPASAPQQAAKTSALQSRRRPLAPSSSAQASG